MGNASNSAENSAKTAEIRPIAYIHNDFKEKFGIPRQSGLVPDMKSVIVFEKEFRSDDSLRGLDEFSHLWLIWHFSENGNTVFSPTVRPPRLGGNTRMGVFATRSPFRPNSLGLSSVKIEEIRRTNNLGTVIVVSGADLMDKTPIFDIKPYIPYTDCHTDARGGFSEKFRDYRLEVVFDDKLLQLVEKDKRSCLIAVLENDPRPSYQNDENRVYKMDFGIYAVSFTVKDGVLTVTDLKTR